MYSGASFMFPRTCANLVQSESAIWPLRIDCNGIMDSAESILMAISARPISREKKRVGLSDLIAALRAMSKANVDLPIAGLAATMISCPGWKPFVRASRSVNPVGTPTRLPSRFCAASISSIAASRETLRAT